MPQKTVLVWLVPLAIMIARLAYARFLSPYELVADEGQYWDWSRHLDWSYFEHGPGVAWVIAAATRALGVSAWAIRAPAAVFGAITMVAVGALAAEGDRSRPTDRALMAMTLFFLIPAYQLVFLLMTPDAGYLAFWAIAVWAGWRAVKGELDREPQGWAWILAGAAIGMALLFNYATIILVVAFAGFLWTSRARLSGTGLIGRGLTGAAALMFCALPILVWNVQHDFAALRHMLGYLDLPGGIYPSRPAWDLAVTYPFEYVGGTIGIIGPALALMWIGARTPRSDHARWLLWCALPLLLVFLAASIRTRIQGNWPLPAFLTLTALAANAIVTTPRDRTTAAWWRAVIGFGAVTAVLIHLPFVTTGLPLIGRFVPADRFTGAAAAADRLSPIVERFRERFGDEGMLIAASHNDAGRVSFYLPGHPIVRTAGRYFGLRVSSYDFFADTRLDDPSVQGKPALLIGGTPESWQRAVRIDGFEIAGDAVYIAGRFRVP